MCYIYTMEYYTVEKNNDILKFSSKWMDLENIMLCDWCNPDPERQIYYVLTYKLILDIKQRKKTAYSLQPQRT